MKDKTRNCIITGTILIIFSICVFQLNENTITTTSNIEINKTIGWGIKRASNNMQPDVGSANKQLLEKYEGICLGKDTEKIIYLTFDEGYEAGYTSQILDILKNNDVKATFFITAHYLNTATELVQRMINEEHIIRKSHCKPSKYAKHIGRRNTKRNNAITSSCI